MMQSSLQCSSPEGLHAAIIMDGNGRWANARGRPRIAGHRAGADAVRRTVEAAPKLGVGTLTLYAFSSDNWKRPTQEVRALMRLFRIYLRSETAKCVENRIRLEIIGRRDRLSASLRADMEAAEEATRRATAEKCRLLLRVAIDYSSRDAILRAVQRIGSAAEVTRELFSAMLADPEHAGQSPDVDLLIRTGGERRLSDFLLWECAYAEFYFTQRMWPDFGGADLEEAIGDFRSRERRFGRVGATAAG